MPRCPRVKSADSVSHIMMRSISDVLLFRNDADKDMYLKIIKRYQEMFLFKVYAYCLMDTYIQLLIDCNGADLSKMMHGINQSYAQKYNGKYKRHGPLFESRFKSNILNNDMSILNISAYINKIPKYLKDYEGVEEKYKYSSFGQYIGTAEDDFGLLDTSSILNQFSSDTINAREKYLKFVREYDEENFDEDVEFSSQKSEYRSCKHALVRNVTPGEVVDFVASYINKDKYNVKIKYIKDAVEIKALSAFLMRCLCDMNQDSICSEMGNISQSHVSKLCHIGVRLIEERVEYKNIINDFLQSKASGQE